MENFKIVNSFLKEYLNSEDIHLSINYYKQFNEIKTLLNKILISEEKE